jgi:signal transduction histidine kinase
VFANLLDNAAKYADRGGHIWLTTEQQGSEVTVKTPTGADHAPPSAGVTVAVRRRSAQIVPLLRHPAAVCRCLNAVNLAVGM